ncbi:PblA [Streptococcus mitis]|uniref:PblA n=1 Tax=Streptococcus mitis TaxID=28037 RepID=A0A1X1KTL1_STRMT|nr:PblA [Streptococcus mitis]ORP02787.1 PblA [Streptococcus mitis]
MATELGKAYVQIIPSAKGISGMIQKEMGGEVASAGVSAGESLGSKMMGAVSGVIAAAGIGQAIGASITEGAALQQSIGGIETLFKTSAGKVRGYAEEAYRTTGLSANKYMENVTGFSASLLQSLGGDVNLAADVANRAMVDMSDNANKMGTSMDSIQMSYQGFAKQNYTMLDNLKLGYGGTQQEMKRLIADAASYKKEQDELNVSVKDGDMSFGNIVNAISVVQKKLKITGTTANEASTTFTGSFESMKAAAQNVLGKLSLGEDIQPALQALMETTSTFLFGNLIPMIGNILKQIPNLILGGIKGVFSGIFGEGLGSIMGGIVTALGSAFLAFKAFSAVSGLLSGIPAVLTTIKTAVTGLFTAMSANPIGIAIAAIAALTAGLVYFFTQTEMGRQIWQGFMDWFSGVWQSVAPVLTEVWNGIVETATAVWNNMMAAVAPIIQAVVDFIRSVWDGISLWWTENQGLIQQTFTTVWNAIQTVIQTVMPIIQSIIETAMNILAPFIEATWNNICTVVTTVWELIKIAIQTAMDVISGIIKAVMAIINGDWGTAWNAIKGVGEAIWNELSAAGKAIFDGFAQILSNIWNTIKSVASSAWEGLKSTVLGLIDGLVQGAQRAWESMKQGVSDLVSNVTSIFDGIRNIDLWSAGKAILDGFLGGLKSAWDSVTDFVGGIAGWIADHKGPIEYDRKLLIPAGNAIMQGLDRGLQDRFKDVKKSVSGMAGEISNAFSNDDFGLSGTPTIAKKLETSLAMPSAQIEAKDSQTVSEIAILRASMEKILTAILEKPSDTYLDADKISMSVYQRQGAIYAREGI